MSDVDEKIIEMIQNNATANEISQVVGISNEQLFNRLHMLKVKECNLYRKYYYDGEIGYQLCKGTNDKKDICLLTRPIDNEIKMVFISDLHLSNTKDRVDLLNQVYEFCSKEGIHVIINGGDLIDGFVGNINSKKFKTADAQIRYVLNYHPYDKNIINFVCLGNHDYSVFENSGQNIETILSAQRHDIVSLGYGFGKLKIKNDEIIVRHKIPTMDFEKVNNYLIISGHYHQPKNICNEKITKINIPPLSEIVKDVLPGFIKATIRFNDGVINYGIFEQYVFLDKMYKVNESNYEIHSKNKTESIFIENEEDRMPYKEESKINVLKTYSKQIEKFNKRYNR